MSEQRLGYAIERDIEKKKRKTRKKSLGATNFESVRWSREKVKKANTKIEKQPKVKRLRTKEITDLRIGRQVEKQVERWVGQRHKCHQTKAAQKQPGMRWMIVKIQHELLNQTCLNQKIKVKLDKIRHNKESDATNWKKKMHSQWSNAHFRENKKWSDSKFE